VTAWAPDLQAAVRRLTVRLRAEGMERPEMAASVLALRGASRLSRDEFARLLGVDVELVRGLEEGRER
jgi:DNA-binding transcriptional regulator YiaG